MPYVVALLRAATQRRPCKKTALSYTRRRGLSNEDWGRSNESRSQKSEARRRNAKKKPGARSQKSEEGTRKRSQEPEVRSQKKKGQGWAVSVSAHSAFRNLNSSFIIHHSSFIIHNGGTARGTQICDTRHSAMTLKRLLIFIPLLLIAVLLQSYFWVP